MIFIKIYVKNISILKDFKKLKFFSFIFKSSILKTFISLINSIEYVFILSKFSLFKSFTEISLHFLQYCIKRDLYLNFFHMK